MPVIVEYNHLPRCAAECIARQDDLSTAVAKVMHNTASTMAPVLTGALKAGVQVTEGNPAEVTASSIEGGATREYAQYVEYGTRHASAQPFMMPGFAVGVASVPIKGRTDFGVYIEAVA